jgi:hypothetical protein
MTPGQVIDGIALTFIEPPTTRVRAMREFWLSTGLPPNIFGNSSEALLNLMSEISLLKSSQWLKNHPGEKLPDDFHLTDIIGKLFSTTELKQLYEDIQKTMILLTGDFRNN